MNGAGQAGITFNNSFLDGPHTVVATYNGSAASRPSCGSAGTLVVPFSNQIYAVGAGLGSIPAVKVYDALTGVERFSFFAYDVAYVGGVRVGIADVTGDGYADVIVGTTPGPVGGHVKVFDGLTGAEVRSFLSRPGSTAGIFVAGGDVNGDGYADIIVGGDKGEADGHVTVYSGNPKDIGTLGVPLLLRDIHAFTNFLGGARVAGGDVDGDGFADVIVGSGFGAKPNINVFSGASGVIIRSFLAYDPTYLGDVFVAVANLNNDRYADIVTGARTANGSHVEVFDGTKLATPTRPLPTISFISGDRTGAGFTAGSIGAVDRTGDGISELLVTFAGPPASQVQTVTLAGAPFGIQSPFPGFRGDIFVG
jgi:hypothetical protein